MRRLNWPIWTAAPLGLATFLSYPFVFLKWPLTRDVPWANLLLLALTVTLVAAGLRRAFAAGRGAFSKAVAVCLAAVGLFGIGTFVAVVMLPQHLAASSGAPAVGEKVSDFTLLDTNDRPVSLSELFSAPVGGAAPTAVLLIFEMGHGCHACSSELHDMQRHLGELRQAGIRPVAISNDPPDVSRALSQAAGYTFTFLSDPQHAVIEQFDLLDRDEGDAARPAEFLIDRQGIVRWRMLTDSIFVRARAGTVLDAAKAFR